MKQKISVIITNWNGCKLLQKHLTSVLHNSPEACEFIIADDASTDDSLQYVSQLQKKYSRIKIIKQPANTGFIYNSNNAVGQSRGDLVVLLNNDINVFPGYIKHSLHHFTNSKLFGVGFSEINHPNWPKIFWQDGYLQYSPVVNYPKAHITGWLSGGSSIIRKSIYKQLGGFDGIYAPFYCEDLDLGFRAWKSGFISIWEPKSQVNHCHESTTSRFPKRFLDYVKERNRLLTVWRNISDPKLLSSNKLALITRIILGPNYIKIILAARKCITNHPPPITLSVLKDIEVFNLFKNE